MISAQCLGQQCNFRGNAMKLTPELESLGFTQEDLDDLLEKVEPSSPQEIAKIVIKAFNIGEKHIPIYIAVLLATAVLEPARTRDLA